MDLKDDTNPSGPTDVNDLHVEVDRDLCIGASACIPVAEKTFALDDAGKAVILVTATEENEESIIDAARVCPVQAIKIKRKSSGEQVYPE
jgi:ferredoxin